MRIGKQTEKVIAVLQSRQTSKSAIQYPVDVTHMFVSNRMKDEHNSQMLEKLPSQKFSLMAVDSKRDVQTQRIETPQFCQNAETVGVGARVVLTKNIDVSDGLVKSAAGIVTGFLPSYTCNESTEEQAIVSFKPKYI